MTKTSKIGQKYYFSERYSSFSGTIVKEHGLSAAAVWGVIFGLSQIPQEKGGLGYCNASQETIGEKVGLTRKTIRAKISILVENGWLEDLTPEFTKKPHHYVVGDKAIQSFLQDEPKKNMHSGRSFDDSNQREETSDIGRNSPSQTQPNDGSPNMGKNYSSKPRKQGDNRSDMGKNDPSQSLEQGEGSSNMGNECPSQRLEQGGGSSDMGNEYSRTWGKNSPDMGKNYPQIESLKESLIAPVKNVTSSSPSSGKGKNGKPPSQIISNEEEDEDGTSIVQTQRQETFLAIFRAAGIWKSKQRELLRASHSFELDDVLAVLAWCHTRASNIDNPALITARNLLEGNLPSATCYEPTYWNRYIPDAILKNAGLMDYVQEKMGDNGYGRDDPENDLSNACAQPELVFDGPDDALQAWQTSLGQLRLEMTNTTFDTWVRDIEPAVFEELESVPFINLAGEEDGIVKRGVLTLAVMTPFARDWLEDRLESRLNRLLSGAMGQDIQVKFEVKETMDT